MITFSFSVYDSRPELVFHGTATQVSDSLFRFDFIRKGFVFFSSTQTLHDFVTFMLKMGYFVNFIGSSRVPKELKSKKR